MELAELLELMQEDLDDGYAGEAVEEVNEALARDMTHYNALTQGLVAGRRSSVPSSAAATLPHPPLSPCPTLSTRCETSKD